MRILKQFPLLISTFIVFGFVNSTQVFSSESVLMAENKNPKIKTKKAKKPKNDEVETEDGTTSSDNEAENASSSTPAAPVSSKSEAIRAGQNFAVDALYTPLSDFMLRYGVSFAKSISPKLRLGLTYLSGSETLNLSQGSVYGKATLTGMAVYAQGRYFIGNSFNILGGVGYRSGLVDYKIYDATYGVSGQVEINSVTIPLFIGNAWTWKSGFSIGVDWIGVFFPVGGSAKAKLSGNLPSSTISDLNDKFLQTGDKLAKSSSLTLLLTSIGWAF